MDTDEKVKPEAGFDSAAPCDYSQPQLQMDRKAIKVIGRRTLPATSGEAFRRAQVLQAQLELLNPSPRPRGFVFKARTREDYERWRKQQANPRLW